MKKIFLITTAVLALTVAHGQTTFQKTYGTSNYEGVQCLTSLGDGCVKQLDDGGYIVCGTTTDSTANQTAHLFILKLDNNGDTLSIRKYSQLNSYTDGDYIIQTTDGGYIVGGEGGDPPIGSYIIKLNSNLDTLWTRAYSPACRSACITSDGNFVLGVYTPNNNFGLIKLNNSGNLIWAKTYSSFSSSSDFYAINIKKKKIFTSFSTEDKRYRSFLVAQSKNERSPFNFVDMSVKKPWPEKVWKEKCRTKIQQCDGMIVLLSKNTWHSSGVRWEVKCAKEEKIPLVGMHIKKNDQGAIPPELEGKKIITWDWKNLGKTIDNI